MEITRRMSKNSMKILKNEYRLEIPFKNVKKSIIREEREGERETERSEELST